MNARRLLSGLLVATVLAVVAFSAHAATGLAIVSTAACNDKAVVDCSAPGTQVLKTPAGTDLVRVSATNLATWDQAHRWRRFDTLTTGQQYEACLTDVVEGVAIQPSGAPCGTYGFVVKQGRGFFSLLTPALWNLYTGSKITSTHPSEAACAAAAVALKTVKAYTCRTSTGVSVKYDAPVELPPVSVPPVVVPPVTPPSTPPVAGAKKWHPGHYIRCNCLAVPAEREVRAALYRRIVQNDAGIKGALISVPWGSIEKARGVYDFAEIDADLAVLKSMGKKLIIEIWWQKYGGAPNTTHFPQYILDAGGVQQVGTTPAYTVRMDLQEWQDRYVALQAALAARYDADASVEQVAITETASTSAFGFLTVLPRVAAAWPRTATVLYANWVDTPELARDLLAKMPALGAGIGSPDIIGAPGMNYEDMGSKALRGVGMSTYWAGVVPKAGEQTGDYGKRDYRGVIPVAYQYQALLEVGAAKLIDYALDTLKATHLIWSVTDNLSADVNYTTGVLPVLKAKNYRTVTACPTAFAACVQ